MDRKVYREVNGEKINGRLFSGIIKNGGYFVTDVAVYSDGMIDCWGLMNMTTFKEKLSSGWIRVSIPDNSEVHFQGLGIIKAEQFLAAKTNEDFIKEIEDAITELNGGRGRIAKCMQSFKSYLLEDNNKNFKLLKEAFEDLPSHKRVLFEYVEYKDPLCAVMKTSEKWTKEQRIGHLNDYFEDEWNELDLK